MRLVSSGSVLCKERRSCREGKKIFSLLVYRDFDFGRHPTFNLDRLTSSLPPLVQLQLLLLLLLLLLRSLHVAQAWVCCLSVALALSDCNILRFSRVPSRAQTDFPRPASSLSPSSSATEAMPTAARAAFIEPISFSVAERARPPIAYPRLSRSRSPFVIPSFVCSSRAASSRPRPSNPLFESFLSPVRPPICRRPRSFPYIWSVSASHRRHVQHATDATHSYINIARRLLIRRTHVTREEQHL